MEGRAGPPLQPLRPESRRRTRVLGTERRRVIEATARCCARTGFADATVGEITAEAGIDEDVFARLFADKEECFLAAGNAVLTEVFAVSSFALEQDKPLLDRVDDGVAALVELMATQPSYATIALLDSRVAGARARALYRSGTRILAAMLDMQRASLPPGVTVPSTAAQAALGGPRFLVAGELAAGRAGDLGQLLPDYVYATHVPFLGAAEAARRAHRVAESSSALPQTGEAPPRDDAGEQPTPPVRRDVSGAADTDRLLDAMVELTAEVGYAEVSVDTLVERTGVPKEAFEALFEGRRDCLIEAWSRVLEGPSRLIADRWSAGGAWVDRVRACLEAVVEWAAAEPVQARVLTVEIQAAGPRAHRLYRRALDRLVPFLDEGRASSTVGEQLPARASGLALGGAESIVFDEIVEGRADQLPRLLPDLLFAVLVPFLGPEVASREARRARRE